MFDKTIVKEFADDNAFRSYFSEFLKEKKKARSVHYKESPISLKYKYFEKIIDFRYTGTDIQCRLPKSLKLTKNDSLAYGLCTVSSSNFRRLKHWDVSEITDFTGCFYHHMVNTKCIRDWDVSNGRYFGCMFCGSCDRNYEISNGFKYLRNWDCSKGLVYNEMFNISCDELNYEAISHIKVNPKGSFISIFGKLPIEETEHFRSWFPDMNIREIRCEFCI